MKKKKFFYLFIFVFFVFLFIFLFLFFFLRKEEEKSVSVKIPYGPVEKFTLPYDRIVSYVDGYFLVNQGNQSILLQEEDRKELLTFPIVSRYLQVFYDQFFLLKDASMYHLYDEKGEELLTSEQNISVLQDKVTQEFYFYNQEILYNASLEPIYQTKDIEVVIINQEVYADYKIYSLESHKQLGTYQNAFQSGNVFVLEEKNSIKVYFPSENSWETFTRYEIQFGRIFFYRDDTILSVSNDGTIYRGEEATRIEVEHGYYIDASTCDVGGVLKNDKEETLYAGCAFYFDTKYLDKGFYSAGNNEEIAIYFLDGRVLQNANVEGDYFLSYDEDNDENIVYNMQLEKVEVPLCKGYYSIQKLDSIHYVCSSPEGYFILDSTLQERLYTYDNIEILDQGVAIVEKDNQYGFFANEELYMDLQPYYDGAFFAKENDSTAYMVFSQMFRSVVIKIMDTDSFLPKEELVYQSEMYEDTISLEDMIAKYHLENIEEDIAKREAFFKKFAYLVDSNERLGEYKNYVMDSFIVLSDFYDLLDEEQFLYHLKQLSMTKVDTLQVSGAVGVYEDANKAISFTEDSPRVLYHEIMHFIDYNLEKDTFSSYYLCSDNKLLDFDMYHALDKSEKELCKSYYDIYHANFLTEAGAEVFMADYFHHDVTVVYYEPVLVYEALSYLLGASHMQEIYLKRDSTHAIYQELVVNKGMDYALFSKALKCFDSIVESYSEEKIVDVADSLVDIYPLYKDGNWYEDIEFLTILSMLVEPIYRDSESQVYSPNASLYKEHCFSIASFDTELLKKKEEFKDYSYRISSSRLMIKKDGIKYVIDVWKEGIEAGSLVLSFDFQTGEILNYQYYACS